MRFWTFVSGPIDTNAFLVADESSGDAMIVDAPPGVHDELVAAVQRENVTVRFIVLTHAHWDHIVDAAKLRTTFGVPLLAHPDTVPQLEKPQGGGTVIDPVTPDRTIRDGDIVELGQLRFHVIDTPGHATGQVSLVELDQNAMFGGDTLFPDGYGGIDGSEPAVRATAASMKRLLDLPDEMAVHPGHGLSTTVGRERGWMVDFVDAEYRPEQ